MKRTRRIGAENSETRAVILDTTEQLMVNEGYAAVSTRRVATEIDLAPGLVHYYFPTTDDLLVAVYRRAAEKTIERLREAFLSEHPLRALWTLSTDAACTALAMEFMAMANHRKAIRAEIADSSEKVRAMQADALSKLRFDKDAHRCSPVGVAVLIAGISRLLVMEKSLGISGGHAEASAIVKHWLQQLEKGTKPPRRTGSARKPQRNEANARVQERTAIRRPATVRTRK